jgi:hypothetical protein
MTNISRDFAIDLGLFGGCYPHFVLKNASKVTEITTK